MKTAISIPNALFAEAERMLREMRLSRSALYVLALTEFIQAHRRDNITKALNSIYRHEPSSIDNVFTAAQTKILPEEEW